MTILQNFAPIFFLALFILIHFIYKGLKNIKNNKKIIEKNPICDYANYEIIKINKNNYIARYIPLKQYIYNGKKSILVSFPYDSELCFSEKEALNRLENFILEFERKESFNKLKNKIKSCNNYQ